MDEKQPPMRILQCVSHLALGGAEEVMLSLVSLLRPYAAFGVAAALASPPNPVGARMLDSLQRMDVPVWIGPPRHSFGLGNAVFGAQGLIRAIREFRPTIVHLHTEIPEACFGLARWISSTCRGVKLVRTIHNTQYWPANQLIGRQVDRMIGASRVIAVSDAAKVAYSAFRCGSAAESSVIYNGVTGCSMRQASYRGQAGSVRALLAGRLEWQKGADLLPAILDRVQLPPDISLHVDVVGEGTFTRLFSDTSQARSGATWSLHAPFASLRDELHKYDLVLMPSRFEGLGLITIESILSGVPVVVTDAPGLNETVPESYPYVARAGDASHFAEVVSLALQQRGVWSRDVAAAKRFCELRFSPTLMAERYLAVYRSLSLSAAAAVSPSVAS